MARIGLLIAAVIAAFAIAGTVIALTLPHYMQRSASAQRRLRCQRTATPSAVSGTSP